MYKPERITKRRNFIGLQQNELAEKVGVSAQQISKYERGVTMPSADTLTLLADVLLCSTDYLLGRVESPDVGTDLDTMERQMVFTFRERKKKLSTAVLNQVLNKLEDPMRNDIIRLVKFFLKNPGSVDDITDDS